jgi:hypothetical protein
MKKQWMVYVGLVLLGVVIAPKVRTLPGLNKLPSL